ncbi:hypothetical protein HDU96_010840 [Phlyctochytrium bullatum]|nr:hypothetical protein HDU96_010840 [Phlyctochytrium bullatum]
MKAAPAVLQCQESIHKQVVGMRGQIAQLDSKLGSSSGAALGPRDVGMQGDADLLNHEINRLRGIIVTVASHAQEELKASPYISELDSEYSRRTPGARNFLLNLEIERLRKIIKKEAPSAVPSAMISPFVYSEIPRKGGLKSLKNIQKDQSGNPKSPLYPRQKHGADFKEHSGRVHRVMAAYYSKIKKPPHDMQQEYSDDDLDLVSSSQLIGAIPFSTDVGEEVSTSTVPNGAEYEWSVGRETHALQALEENDILTGQHRDDLHVCAQRLGSWAAHYGNLRLKTKAELRRVIYDILVSRHKEVNRVLIKTHCSSFVTF